MWLLLTLKRRRLFGLHIDKKQNRADAQKFDAFINKLQGCVPQTMCHGLLASRKIFHVSRQVLRKKNNRHFNFNIITSKYIRYGGSFYCELKFAAKYTGVYIRAPTLFK